MSPPAVKRATARTLAPMWWIPVRLVCLYGAVVGTLEPMRWGYGWLGGLVSASYLMWFSATLSSVTIP